MKLFVRNKLKSSFEIFTIKIRATVITQQTFVFAFSSRLSSSLQKTSSRRLQDVLIKTNIFALVIRFQDVFKTSSRCLAKTSSRRFKDVFNTSSRHLQDILASLRRLQNVFMTSAKASLRYLQGVLQRCLQDVLKTYYQVKLFA